MRITAMETQIGRERSERAADDRGFYVVTNSISSL